MRFRGLYGGCPTGVSNHFPSLLDRVNERGQKTTETALLERDKERNPPWLSIVLPGHGVPSVVDKRPVPFMCYFLFFPFPLFFFLSILFYFIFNFLVLFIAPSFSDLTAICSRTTRSLFLPCPEELTRSWFVVGLGMIPVEAIRLQSFSIAIHSLLDAPDDQLGSCRPPGMESSFRKGRVSDSFAP